MSLSDREKLELRAAIGVARSTNPPRDLDDALRILNGQVIDGDYWTSLIGVDAINDAKARCNSVFPGAYDVIWERFKEELKLAPPIGGDVFSPEPTPPPSSYPTPDLSSLQAEVAELRAIVQSLQSHALTNVVPVNGTKAGDVGFQLNTQTVTHRLYGNSGDYGLRLWFNYREPYVNGSSYSVPSLGQQYLFFEQDGAISVGYFKPETVTAGPYDNLKGKGLVFRARGMSEDGRNEKHAAIFTGQVGRGLRLGVCASNPNFPDRFDFQIDPDSDDPISITVGGVKRRVKMRDDGTLYAE